MKKILSILMLCILSVLVIGCSCEKNKNNKDKNNDLQQEQIEKTIGNLYTDDKKLVYDNGGLYKLVFYYSGNEITGLEHYYEYKDEAEAKAQYEKDKESYKDNATIKKVATSGKYVVYVMAGDQYEGKTVEEVKSSYSFLLPVYEK